MTHGGTPPAGLSNGTITNISGNTLTFDGATGLQTGDSVTYQAPSSGGTNNSESNPNVIGGLVDGDTYGVIVTGADTLELGVEFTFGQQNAAKSQTTMVDAATTTLHFDAPDNLHTGDMVSYVPGGGTPIQAFIGGSLQNLPAGSYTVTVVDPFTIRLSNLATPSTAVTFVPDTVVGSKNYIFNIAGHGFNQNDAVTYTAPQTATFNGDFVNVQIDSSQSPEEPLLNSDGTVDLREHRLYLLPRLRLQHRRPAGHLRVHARVRTARAGQRDRRPDDRRRVRRDRRRRKLPPARQHQCSPRDRAHADAAERLRHPES